MNTQQFSTTLTDVILESARLISGRQDNANGKPRRVYVVTGEGRRSAGISDAKQP